MKLKKSLPPGRSYKQIKNHYLVEKAIAKRLKESNQEERKLVYASMYKELFRKVPDHPRLTRRESKHLTANANKSKLSIINRFLDRSDVFLEFAPGDCKFVIEVANCVKYAYGVDISEQGNLTNNIPDNFKLILYNGYNLDEIQSNSIDIVFSDQLIEHFHPEDTKLHFELVHRILKKGGKYIFRTPHSLSGPHDISQYFSDEPECFHLKEWTYIEIKKMLMNLKYSDFHTYWQAKGISIRMPYYYFAMWEQILGLFPKRYIKIATKFLIPSLYGVAIK